MPGADWLHALRGLRESIERLSLEIEQVAVCFELAAIGSYPGGERPTSTVRLEGKGKRGCGEHVGWTVDAHQAFAVAAHASARGRTTVQQYSATLRELPSYDRAALEAAAIDLALRQNNTNLFDLAGIEPDPVRYVVSFATAGDPVAEAARVAPGDVMLKIDAIFAWSDDVYRELARLGRVAVVDFKRTGETADHERACRHLPSAWIEDPAPGAAAWSNTLASRYSADANVMSVAALESMEPRPAAINVKPARMGSVLEAIDCLAYCRAGGFTSYIGGMFEVGVGRSQLLTLAALACPDEPNDIAPLRARAGARIAARIEDSYELTRNILGDFVCVPKSEPLRPLRLAVDAEAHGFGTNAGEEVSDSSAGRNA